MDIVRGRKYSFGVLQGSILGSIFFYIFLTDLFLLISDTNFSSYAEDNNIYIYNSGNSIDDVISSLQWFSHNQIKENTDKCHSIVSTKPTEIGVGESQIKNSTCEKLFGVKIDNKHNFDTYVKGVCKKANNKLRATPYMFLEKRSFS